mmetsp:Transcript_62640/g.91848  ORF Transcript_62640/g.91848 Transcript_62640/m.91848 type:complete len:100 (+) Transcript_62640:1031-1330(+)
MCDTCRILSRPQQEPSTLLPCQTLSVLRGCMHVRVRVRECVCTCSWPRHRQGLTGGSRFEAGHCDVESRTQFIKATSLRNMSGHCHVASRRQLLSEMCH